MEEQGDLFINLQPDSIIMDPQINKRKSLLRLLINMKSKADSDPREQPQISNFHSVWVVIIWKNCTWMISRKRVISHHLEQESTSTQQLSHLVVLIIKRVYNFQWQPLCLQTSKLLIEVKNYQDPVNMVLWKSPVREWSPPPIKHKLNSAFQKLQIDLLRQLRKLQPQLQISILHKTI